jgi:hypothetical protein
MKMLKILGLIAIIAFGLGFGTPAQAHHRYNVVIYGPGYYGYYGRPYYGYYRPYHYRYYRHYGYYRHHRYYRYHY